MSTIDGGHLGALYEYGKEARGSPPDRRVALREQKAKPILDDLESWLQSELPKLSGKTPLANAKPPSLTTLIPKLGSRMSSLASPTTRSTGLMSCCLGIIRGEGALTHHYNIERTHQGKMCCGRTPFQTMIEGKEIWKEKFVN